MINIAVCDDDKEIVAEIESFLFDIAQKKHIKINIETYCDGSGLEQDICKGVQYNLILLDIEMKQNGIVTARRIRDEGYDPLIIYVSNHEKYLRELFEVDAFRFLDKPINPDKLEKYFMEAMNKLQRDDQYFVYYYNRQMNRIRIKDILYFESDRRKVLIHKLNGEILHFYEKLNNVEMRIGDIDTLFLRTHQSFLVNSEYIVRWKISRLDLEGGVQIPISEEYQKRISYEYGDFIRKDIFGEQFIY